MILRRASNRTIVLARHLAACLTVTIHILPTQILNQEITRLLIRRYKNHFYRCHTDSPGLAVLPRGAEGMELVGGFDFDGCIDNFFIGIGCHWFFLHFVFWRKSR